MPPRSLDTTELSWPEVRDALEAGYDTIVVAAGSIEQHGPHLPEMTDTLIGTHLVRAIVGRLPLALQGPTISIGCSEHHMSFPGTVTLREETFIAVVQDVARSLARHGFRTIVFIPSHGGNFAPLAKAVEGLSDDLAEVQVFSFSDLVGFVGVLNETAAQFGVSPEVAGAHAGESETSLDLALRPDLVRMDDAEEGYVGPFNAEVSAKIFNEGMPALTRNGILGDARPATAAHGVTYLAQMADYLAQWIEAKRG